MSYYGDIHLGDTIDFAFTTTSASTGAPTTLSGVPVLSCYVGSSTTEITAGITLTVDFDTRTGFNHVTIVASSGNGYTAATNVDVVITTGTVGGTSAVGYVVGSFSIDKRGVNQILGTAVSTPATAGVLDVNVKNINNAAAATPGASGGLHINGSNSGTTTYAALTVTGSLTISDGLLVSRSTSNASAATFTGNGTGSGAVFTSGAGATGDGVQMTAGSTAGNGLKLTKTGAGNDLAATTTTLSLAKTTNITGFNDIAAGAAMTLTVAYDAAKTASQAGDIMKVSTGTGANQLDVTSGIIKSNLSQILGTALTETAGQISAGFKQFFNIASPTSTMNVITSVTTTTTATNLTTNNDKTGYSLSSAAIQAIWDYATSLLTAVGSIGKLLVTNIDAAISSRSTLGGTAQTGDAYGLLNSAQAEPSSVPAANASPVAKIGYVFAKMRNKRITTATTDTLRNDGDSGNIAAATLSDDGTSFTKTKDA